MQKFDKNKLLLTSSLAQELYNDFAKDMPIYDYHCHLSAKDIYEDKRFDNLTDLWLRADHYKWRLMRAGGISEDLITGRAGDKEKFLAFASCLDKAIGNPIYTWCNMELSKYFGIDEYLTRANAEDIWDKCNRYLANTEMTPSKILSDSKVQVIGTTDNPTDSLEYHRRLKKECDYPKVLPTFRPDNIINIQSDDWLDNIHLLECVTNKEIDGLGGLLSALEDRMDYFALNGCRLSDHGMGKIPCAYASLNEIDSIVKARLAGREVGYENCQKVETYLHFWCGEQYHKRDWVWQIHFGCLRNANTKGYKRLGKDSGYDCILASSGKQGLVSLLDRLAGENSLPKMIIYSLNPNDNIFLDCLIASFQGENGGGIQHGSAWWFGDNKDGIQAQLTSLAHNGLLGNFVGMLTDSRSFLSYVRHDYFRRILCSTLSKWAENGEVCNQVEILGEIVKGICFDNAKKFFGG